MEKPSGTTRIVQERRRRVQEKVYGGPQRLHDVSWDGLGGSRELLDASRWVSGGPERVHGFSTARNSLIFATPMV